MLEKITLASRAAPSFLVQPFFWPHTSQTQRE